MLAIFSLVKTREIDVWTWKSIQCCLKCHFFSRKYQDILKKKDSVFTFTKAFCFFLLLFLWVFVLNDYSSDAHNMFVLLTMKLADESFQFITYSVLLKPIKGDEVGKISFFNGFDDHCYCFPSKSRTELIVFSQTKDSNRREPQYFVKI